MKQFLSFVSVFYIIFFWVGGSIAVIFLPAIVYEFYSHLWILWFMLLTFPTGIYFLWKLFEVFVSD
jgi:hypothetical protein